MHLGYTVYPVISGNELKKQFSGSNQNGVLFVYNTDDKVHLDFLNKILSAIELNTNEVLFLELEDSQIVKLPNMADEFSIEKIIVFDILPKRICINSSCMKYDIFGLDQTKLLFADSLNEIKSNKELKKNLWICLKEMFGV